MRMRFAYNYKSTISSGNMCKVLSENVTDNWHQHISFFYLFKRNAIQTILFMAYHNNNVLKYKKKKLKYI